MRSTLQKILICPAALSLAMIFSACAPTQPAPEAEATETPREIKPLLMVTATPRPETVQPADSPQRPVFNPDNPDWEVRYQELYENFAANFTPPAPGQPVQVELQNGNEQNGILKNLTTTGLTLGLGNGEVTFTMDALSPQSAARFFESAYAREQALKQGRLEYNRWQRMQEAKNAPPGPAPRSGVASEENGNPASTPGQNGVDVPDNPSKGSEAPRNEGPTGRVAQVEAYIRENAALPQSLRVKAWGPVQKNGNGYKVRVQYSLEAADGFGTSHEDMMFFMYASGRVYRKAAVK